MKRQPSIDIVRGIVMIIMALDHVRDLMHVDSITQSPTDLATTSPLLFCTRWITHLCAPIFVFLAGTSVYLSLQNQNNISEKRTHLIKRGFWLIFVEFTIVNFGLFFDIGFHTLLFEVIAAIGFGFIILGLLLKLNSKTLGIIGLTIILCHNLLPLVPFAENSVLKTVLTPFFSPTVIPFSGRAFVMGYPPIPWLGIMLVGFATGKFFELETEKRKKLFIKIGWSCLVFFIILRFVNIYGDPALWTSQKDVVFTFLSFMNVTKYPPSLLFCLATLGIMFMLLAFAEQFSNGIKKVTLIYGKVPLFYFVVHFYVIHILTLLMLFAQGFNWSQFEFAGGTFGRPKGLESGFPLWAIYLIWISVVVSLYKPSKWFGKYKTEKQYWWLKYI
ncbi:heparan-alpha-glucosaminide N-acetyltransferase domain-containing protein [Flavobacterium sp. 17A]|uniref:Heparan-alpha-glucosaminide N-acetyltransferase domain-containing protein n=1 Tax=Flavobacterium potami TaxID=2872310 RepID=A0A9X1KPA3_9FLAO|nr:heparan-alpha-glucosaminide N-acetyltransferase domain-containing protein [Flavobacterium potami]MBZ4034345.1 heparan-alpha-glucosaminide N-acetyltransferase domain-containing protein [Flavobacterium potami]